MPLLCRWSFTGSRGSAWNSARLSEIASGLEPTRHFSCMAARRWVSDAVMDTYSLPDGPRSSILVVSPRISPGVPTVEAYKWLGQRLTKPPDPSKPWRFCALCWSPQGGAQQNDFEAAVFPKFSPTGSN